MHMSERRTANSPNLIVPSSSNMTTKPRFAVSSAIAEPSMEEKVVNLPVMGTTLLIVATN